MFTSLFLKLINREAASAGSKSEEMVEALGIRRGWHIADFGSGGGHFTFSFARKVGQAGRVYAVDTKRDYLDFVRRRPKITGSATSPVSV